MIPLLCETMCFLCGSLCNSYFTKNHQGATKNHREYGTCNILCFSFIYRYHQMRNFSYIVTILKVIVKFAGKNMNDHDKYT